jgi:hypothetical protein
MKGERTRLRFVDSSDLKASTVDFDELDVETAAGDALGNVEGFLVDVEARRPYYLVVDSGGWFKSRLFLVPIGHARLHQDDGTVVVDVPRATIEAFPEYDEERFPELSDEEMRRFEERTASACCPTAAADALAGRSTVRSHYDRPEWWQDRLYAWPSSERAVTTADSSPHYGGRAQPGDVIGIETGGEQTALGDDAEDENERREAAERQNAQRAREKLPAGKR